MSSESEHLPKNASQPWYHQFFPWRRNVKNDSDPLATSSSNLLHLRRLFDQIDSQKKGFIDSRDILKAIDSAPGEDSVWKSAPVSTEVARRMIDVADTNKNQGVDFNEFVHLAQRLDTANYPQMHQLLSQWARVGGLQSPIVSSISVPSSSAVQNPLPTVTVIGAAAALPWQEKYAESIKVVKHLTAGGVAGAVSRTAVSPLERMKILFQVQVTEAGQARKYRGILSTLYTIAREEGLQGYFKGNGTNVIRIIPYSAIQFASYERYKRLLLRRNEADLDTYRRLIAGALAGITSVVCTYPLDLVRTRLSVQTVQKRYLGVIHCTRLIYKEEGGAIALFRGLSPTILGIAPYVALNFTVYETARGWFKRHYGEPSVVQKLLCGALSGCCAQTATYPLDVIRRRMQMIGCKDVQYKYTGTWSALTTIVREEGYRGLYKGMLPNILKVAPAISVSFVTYEYMKRVLVTN